MKGLQDYQQVIFFMGYLCGALHDPEIVAELARSLEEKELNVRYLRWLQARLAAVLAPFPEEEGDGGPLQSQTT